MTYQNNAAQPGLKEIDAELAAKLDMLRQRIPATDNTARYFFDAVQQHLLSKLRAPVADERAAFDRWLEGVPGFAGPWAAWQARAALASAPVAGEAQKPIGFVDPVYLAGRQRGMKWNAKIYDAPNQEATAPLYAAPQASEAVRDAGITASEDVDEKMREVLQWILDDAASGGVAKLRPQQEKRARAALSAQPGAQRTGGSDAE